MSANDDFDFRKDVIERLVRIEANQERDYKIMNGNGSPGLIGICDDLQNRVLSLEVERDTEAKSHHKFIMFIGWIATTIIALYAAIFKN